MHVASLIIFCHLKKVLRRFCGALLYQISWRAARKANKHGECGGQQLNSVLTVQLMGFFCYSNEIFCRNVGKYVLKQGDVMHMHPSTDTDRQYKTHRKRQYATERLAHTYIHFILLGIGCITLFLLFKDLHPKSDHKVHSGPVSCRPTTLHCSIISAFNSCNKADQ